MENMAVLNAFSHFIALVLSYNVTLCMLLFKLKIISKLVARIEGVMRKFQNVFAV